MKRIALFLAVLSSVLIATVSTQASAPRPLRQSGVAGMLKKAHTLGYVGRATHRLHSTGIREFTASKSDSAAPSQQSAQSLFLPESAFSPAVKNATYWYTTDAAKSDGSWFRDFHSNGAAGNYATFGLLQGVYQRADWSTSGTTVNFRYQGSQYGSSAGATNAFNDGVSYTTQYFRTSSKSCSNNPAVQCAYVVYSDKDPNGNPVFEEYDVLQHGACLAEITGTIPSTIAGSVGSQFAQTMENLDKAAAAAILTTCGSPASSPTASPTPHSTASPTPSPTPPPSTTDFSVISVRFEKAKAHADKRLQNVPVTRIKAGKSVRLSIYVNIRSLASSSVSVSTRLRLMRNGTAIADQSFSNTITRVDLYRFGNKSVKLVKTGKYTLEGSVTIGSKTDRASSGPLSAVKK